MANQLDKPVDTILNDYNVLNVDVIQNQHSITMSACKLWRMNLCAVSKVLPCTFFVAMNYRIKVYTLDTIHSPFKDPIKTIASPTAIELGAGSESPFIINAIKVDRMLEKEILVTVAENGEVCVWRTDDLDAPPLILNNEHATWGIAMHGDQGLLAVSANSYKVTIYNLLEMTKDNPIYGKSQVDEPNYLGSVKTTWLIGHEHNIPNIDFDESGRYLASASTDSTCRVWDITTGKVITQKKAAQKRSARFAEQDGLCWSTKFIKPGNFKYAVCNDKKITKSFIHQIDQGRSTSLSNMGLCHSAAHPAFPMNMSRIFDLDEEDVDFEIYENEGEGDMDDARWDEALLDQENEFMEEVYERQRQEDDLAYNGMYIQARSDTENIIGREEQPSILQERLYTEEPASERSAPVDIDWSATENPAEATSTGWGDPEDPSSGSVGPFDFNGSVPWYKPSFDSGSETESETSEPEEQQPAPSYCIPNIIRTTSSNSLLKLGSENPVTKSAKAYKKSTMGQYLMITTRKDISLASTSIPRMKRIRVEHNIISKIDIRSDPLLAALERINMVEWLPELELFVAANQSGTVALLRIIQIDFDGERQACIFNNEHYLPNDVLQSTPLYGMTVKKVDGDRFTPVSYQIFLFYYSGNVLAYNISRNDSNISIEDIII